MGIDDVVRALITDPKEIREMKEKARKYQEDFNKRIEQEMEENCISCGKQIESSRQLAGRSTCRRCHI